MMTRDDDGTMVTVTLTCEHVTTEKLHSLFEGRSFECWVCTHRFGHRIMREWVTFQSMNNGYTLRCQQCVYSRAYGQARITCMTNADRHARKHAHAVQVTLDGSLLYVAVTDTPDMFQDQDRIPF